MLEMRRGNFMWRGKNQLLPVAYVNGLHWKRRRTATVFTGEKRSLKPNWNNTNGLHSTEPLDTSLQTETIVTHNGHLVCVFASDFVMAHQ